MSSNTAASTKTNTNNGRGKKSKVSRSAKAGLEFPVGRICRLLKAGRYASRIGAGAPAYLAAVLEYLAAEVLEVAGNVVKKTNKTRITPKAITAAVTNDEELNKLFKGVTIAGGGVMPNRHRNLLPESSAKKEKEIGSGSQ
ncbi:hypothetical protein ACP275_14G205500 [Erythranthe tilingii]